MRFMVIVKATPKTESGALPDPQELAEMGAFNQKMLDAGIMLAADGLRDTSHGARISFSETGEPVVFDGPFAETKELVAGFWIISVKSKDEAVAWMRNAPFKGQEIEIRPVFEFEELADIATPEHFERATAFHEGAYKHPRPEQTS